MYSIPLDDPLYICPDAIDEKTADSLKCKIDQIFEGKIVNGSHRDRKGCEVLGFTGPFQRHDLPSVISDVAHQLTAYMQTHRSELPEEIAQDITDDWAINQADIVKIVAGIGYDFAIEGQQETSGPIITLLVEGEGPYTIQPKSADKRVTFGSTVPTSDSIPYTNDSDSYNSVLARIPEHSAMVFSRPFLQTYTRSITNRTSQDRTLPVPRLPASAPSSHTGPSLCIHATLNEATSDANTTTADSTDSTPASAPRRRKRDPTPVYGVPGLSLFEPEAAVKLRLQAEAEAAEAKANASGEASAVEGAGKGEKAVVKDRLRGLGALTVKRAPHYAITLRCFKKALEQPVKKPVQKKIVVSESVGVEFESIADPVAAAFEKAHVHHVYDAIADHFSGTRYQAWPQVDRFVMNLPDYSSLGDIGCGNGKYLGINNKLVTMGCDISEGLARHAHSRGHMVVLGDTLAVPFRTESFDNTICIAVLHHLSTLNRRLAALTELLRVTKPGGRVLVTAWALEQDPTSRRTFQGADVWVPFKTPVSVQKHIEKVKTEKAEADTGASTRKILVHTETPTVESSAGPTETNTAPTSAETSIPDLDIPNMPKPEDFARYYHVFHKGEMEELLGLLQERRVPVEMEEVFYDKGNWCMIMIKK
jgi:alkylated DNA repair protein alkB family protein 8